MLLGHEGPVGQATHLLHDGLGPCHDKGQLAGLRANGDAINIGLAEVGLVEHVAIVAKTKKVAGCGVALEGEEVLEVALAGSSVLPLLQGASRKIAVPVDSGRPAGNDVHASVTVVGNVRHKRPVLAVGAEKNRARVIANSVDDTVCDPCTKSVTVVQTGDGRGNETLRRELVTVGDADLAEPSLVEDNLLVGITVSKVVLGQVSEGVRDVSEGVAVGRSHEPACEVVKLSASDAPGVAGGSNRPVVNTRAERLLELLGCVRRVIIEDSV